MRIALSRPPRECDVFLSDGGLRRPLRQTVRMGFLRWLRFWLWVRPLAIYLRWHVYVDCRTGSDENRGTARAPLKTLTELKRRTHGRMLHGDLHVHMVKLGEDDEFELNVTFAPGVRVIVDGCWLNP